MLIMKKLDHPNICRLFETYEQAETENSQGLLNEVGVCHIGGGL